MALAAVLAIPASGHTSDGRAFANLEFGDTQEQVESKIRGHLVDGSFVRECYGCPVAAALGEYRLEILPEYFAGTLWRVRVVHTDSVRAAGDRERARGAWALLSEAVSAKYGSAKRLASGFPPLTAPQDAGTKAFPTSEWRAAGKRIRLGLEMETEFERTRKSLRERILKGWAFGRGPNEVRVHHYRVYVEIVDTDAEARMRLAAERQQQADRQGVVELGRELF